jgi:hypothetical protein
MQFSDCEKSWFTISHPENMKAVGWCAVLSSPESSPEKMWRQECFHRYEDRNTRPRECAPASEPPIHPPSIPQPIVLGGYCGGASPSSSPGMAMLDPAPDAERRQAGVKRRRTRVDLGQEVLHGLRIKPSLSLLALPGCGRRTIRRRARCSLPLPWRHCWSFRD